MTNGIASNNMSPISIAAQRQKLTDSNEYRMSFFIWLVCVGWGEMMQTKKGMKGRYDY